MEQRHSKAKKEDKMIIWSKSVPMDVAFKAIKSICKITAKTVSNKTVNGAGFFMKVSDSMRCLIINYHVLDPDLIENIIYIEAWNHKTMMLNLKDYKITYFKKPKDMAVIQLKNSDKIIPDIQFLDYDKNYVNGYKIYRNVDVFSIKHPFGESAACSCGKIVEIKDFEFRHNISTDKDSLRRTLRIDSS